LYLFGRDVPGKLREGYTTRVTISGKWFPRKVAFLEWSKNGCEIKVLFKWKNAKEDFSGWIVCKHFYREGDSQQVRNCLEGIWQKEGVGVTLYWIKFHQRRFLCGEGWPLHIWNVPPLLILCPLGWKIWLCVLIFLEHLLKNQGF